MWTRKSYDALFDWIMGGKERERVRAILLEDGLDEIVARLDAANNFGTWHRITGEAANAVGPRVVAASACCAERELDKIARRNGS